MKSYKSGKQHCAEIKAARRAHRQTLLKRTARPAFVPLGRVVPVDYSKLMDNNSYGLSAFAERGFYVDEAFTCCDCGSECVWTAEQQRWWYEIAGGSQYAFAKRCRPCRLRERQRKEISRQVSQAGLLKKQARFAASAAGAGKCNKNLHAAVTIALRIERNEQ